MPRKAKNGVNESNLSKGQLRKLNALRKSLGSEIANRAFSEWLSANIEAGRLSVPRGGYMVRRGRGRVIIERLE